MTLELHTDLPLIPRDLPSARYLVIRLVAPAGEGGPRPAVSISLVLDRSGSMGGGKLRLARQAVEQALSRLEERDSFSVVVFDHEVDTVMPQTPAHVESRSVAMRKLSTFQARGSTNLGKGWLTGCGEVAKRVVGDVVGRTFLLTDGLANVGDRDPSVLGRRASELRRRGVTTSTFGVGSDFDEGLLGRMADEGGGVFHFIARPEEIPSLMAAELGETLDVVARDVRLSVALPQGVRAEPIGTWRLEASTEGPVVSLPDMVSRQEMELVLRLEFPPGGDSMRVEVGVRDREGRLGAHRASLSWQRADISVVNAQQTRESLACLIVDKEGSFAREEALLLNREGRMAEAQRRMTASADRVRPLGGSSEGARQLVQKMDEDAERLGQDMSPMQRKMEHYASSQASRGFDLSGRRKKQVPEEPPGRA